ncbi:MAG: ATP-dependent Clp protease adaptor ClpS [Planctomycetes bacterium]|nr:ATP-dependent Clp protease adaptor ClpS [Planctomycetota bacterium]
MPGGAGRRPARRGPEGRAPRSLEVRICAVIFARTLSQRDGAHAGEPAVPQPAPRTKVRDEKKTQFAPLYRVLIHNDDVTPMDFVVNVLRRIFGKSIPDAARIMLEAHTTGVALVEVVPLERAEFLVDRAHSLARTAKYPLTFTYEPA